MCELQYSLLGSDAPTWHKKFFFRELGREGNPDSAFMLLVASMKKREAGTSESLGAELFARLVRHYSGEHLTSSPREMVRKLVDVVSAGAGEAKASKAELAAGFLHIKGQHAAAGSVGRLRAGLGDRERLLVTSPIPDRARERSNRGQVALDLGQTVEGDLNELPAFFIAPSSAMATGDEPMRKLIWEVLLREGRLSDKSPAGWEHLPCLVGSAGKGLVQAGTSPSKGEPVEPALAREEVLPERVKTPIVRLPSVKVLASRLPILSRRAALWVGAVAVVTFLSIKLVLFKSEPLGPPAGEPTTTAAMPVGTSQADGGEGEGGGSPQAEGIETGRGPEETGDRVQDSGSEGALLSVPALSPVWRRELGGVLTSSPVGIGDVVIFGSRSGKVHCLAKADGTERWSYAGPDGFGSSPVETGGRVFIGCYDGSVFCLDARDGSQVWRHPTGGKVVSSPFVAQEGRVLTGSYDGYLYCLSLEGDLLWRFNAGTRIWSSPTGSGNRVFFGDLKGRIYCLDLSSGKPIWSKNAGAAIYSSPATSQDKVYFGSSEGTVFALSTADGKELWTYKAGGSVSSSIAVGEDALLVGFEDGSLVRLGPEGSEMWKANLQGPVRSRPVLWDDTIAVTCYDGSIVLLDISTGSQLARFSAGGKVYATPLISEDILYFGDMKGTFFALSAPPSHSP